MSAPAATPHTGEPQVSSPAEIAAEEKFLSEAERRIRSHGKRAVEAIVEIGRELVAVKERYGEHRDGRYTEFVTKRLGWSMRSGNNFVSVYEMMKRANFAGLENLNIDASSLYLIAGPSGAPVRDEVLAKAATPEGVTHAEVKAAVAAAKPAPDKAQLIAALKRNDLYLDEIGKGAFRICFGKPGQIPMVMGPHSEEAGYSLEEIRNFLALIPSTGAALNEMLEARHKVRPGDPTAKLGAKPPAAPPPAAPPPAASCGTVPLRPANPTALEAAVYAAADEYFLSTRPEYAADREKHLRACGRKLELAEKLIHDAHAEPAADRQLREAAAAKWKAEGGRVRGNAPWLADDIQKVFNGEIPLNDQWRRALRELLDAPAPLSGKQLFTAVQFALKADERDARRKLAASMGMLVPALERILAGEKSPTQDQVDKLRAYAEARQRKAESAASEAPIAATAELVPELTPRENVFGKDNTETMIRNITRMPYGISESDARTLFDKWLSGAPIKGIVLAAIDKAAEKIIEERAESAPENRLFTLWQALKINTQKRCVSWVEDNCPEPYPLLDDPHPIREAAAPFRSLAKECTAAEIAEFLELAKVMG